MSPKNILNRMLGPAVVIGLVISLLFNFNFFTDKAPQFDSPALADGLGTSVGLPVRLIIERSGVNASVESVGLTVNGAMGVPKGPADVGWFSLGVRPGEVGSAVMDGHYGWKDDIPAVFDNLNKLQAGDVVYVEDGAGVRTGFVVRTTRIYGEYEDASAVFSSTDGGAHLNLITCEGVWDAVKKSYSGRLVVFTDKVFE